MDTLLYKHDSSFTPSPWIYPSGKEHVENTWKNGLEKLQADWTNYISQYSHTNPSNFVAAQSQPCAAALWLVATVGDLQPELREESGQSLIHSEKPFSAAAAAAAFTSISIAAAIVQVRRRLGLLSPPFSCIPITKEC